MPKINTMKKDVDFCMRQIDLLKFRSSQFVTKEVVDLHIHDMEEKLKLLIDKSCKSVWKDTSVELDRRLKQIDEIPQLSTFTQKAEHCRL